MKRFFLIIAVLCTLFTLLLVPTGSIKAQNLNSASACGTSESDLNFMFNNMVELRAHYGNNIHFRAVSYVPLALHLVAATDGTGRINEARVLDFIAALNATYATNNVELQFYIKYMNYVNSDELYTAPKAFSGINKAFVQKKKDALNIFFCNTLDDGSDPNSQTLGYFSNRAFADELPFAQDWVMIKNSEVSNGVSSTIEHELGHFFSLPHTFRGWECAAFMPTVASPCAPKTVPCSGTVVEYVARTGTTANCSTAADGFCDTPADYNFGFGWNNCNYTGIAKDPDCIAVDPDEKNVMGYFTRSCAVSFSTEQKNAMRNDYLNNIYRRYLRDGNTTPLLIDIVDANLLIPANNATVNSYTPLSFDWSDVSGVTAAPNKASGYIFEISTFASFGANTQRVLTSSSDVTINTANTVAGFLIPNKTYYWRVRPYGTYKTFGGFSLANKFTTGSVNAVNEIAGIDNFTILPNPVSSGQSLEINLTSAKSFEGVVKLNTVAGQVVKTEKMRFEAGVNAKFLNINTLSKGIYILTIEAEQGVLNKKVVVSE